MTQKQAKEPTPTPEPSAIKEEVKAKETPETEPSKEGLTPEPELQEEIEPPAPCPRIPQKPQKK